MPDGWRTLPEFLADDCKALLVPSSRQGLPPYRVDLTTYTCSCPDHQTRRRGFPARDLRRACRHIERALRDRGVVLAEMTQAIMDSDARGVPPFIRWNEIEIDGSHAVMTLVDASEWVDVFARKGRTGSVRRFGFSLVQQRWSFGDAPAGAQQIRRAIGEWAGVKIGARRRWPHDEKGEGEEAEEVAAIGRASEGRAARLLLFLGAMVFLLALVWFLSH